MRITLAHIFGAYALVGILVGLNLAWLNQPLPRAIDIARPLLTSKPRPTRVVPFVDPIRLDLAFEQAFSRAEQEVDPLKASVVIIPHHLVAADMVADALNRVSHRRINRVIVVSPNHFDLGQSPVVVSGNDWQVPNGVMRADNRFIDDLIARASLVSVDESPFEKEHGVYGIMPYVQHAFPQASVVTLLVKDRLPLTEAQSLGALLAGLADNSTLVVGSFDFSHEQIELASRFHDQTSIDALQSMDIESFASLDIDSRPGLAVVAGFAQARGDGQFTLFGNKNSVEYVGNPDQTDVTSYITGAYTEGEAQSSEVVTLLSFGDLMLNRDVRTVLSRQGNAWPFQAIRRFLAGTDLTIANLEGTITAEDPVRLEPTSIRFTFDPSVAPTLASLGFDAFNLANNHSRDFGREGFLETQRRLSDVGIASFGDFYNREAVSWVQEVRGQKLGFVGVHTVYGRDPSGALTEIERLRPDVDALIVFAHWGTEYQTTPSSAQQQTAHALIDAGADIVLGSHPHVVQPMEIYQGKLIAYSQGNFVFDQFFSSEVQQGLAYGLVISEKSVEVYLFPHVISPNYQVHLEKPSLANEFFTNISQKSVASDLIKVDMADGHFILPRL